MASQSLKHPPPLRQALEDFSARQLRLLFLLQPWDKRMDFSDQTVAEVKTKEATLKNYFDEVKAVLRDSNWQQQPVLWGVPERRLHASFLSHQAAVHTALCDNLNTPAAMGSLLAIASDAFAYLNQHRAAHVDALLLQVPITAPGMAVSRALAMRWDGCLQLPLMATDGHGWRLNGP